VALDATPAGAPLYERLGFRAEYGLLRLGRPASGGPDLTAFVLAPRRPTGPVDLAQVAALDRAAMGADRGPLLRSLYRRAPEVARLATSVQRATGFCLGRHGARFSQLGPVVAETLKGALSLCASALQAWEGRPIVVDVPASQQRFLAWLLDAGFEVQRPFTRMTYGAPLPRPSGAARVFAICGPEFG
jgi:hypothetical protein